MEDQFKELTNAQKLAVLTVIQYMAKERTKNPNVVFHKDEIFKMIQDELDDLYQLSIIEF